MALQQLQQLILVSYKTASIDLSLICLHASNPLRLPDILNYVWHEDISDIYCRFSLDITDELSTLNSN